LNADLLAASRQRRWTGLFITHSVFEAVYLSTRVLVMSRRPGRIIEEIAVDLPEGRSADTRTSPPYMHLCRRVSQALQQAVGSQPAGATA
jgi:NitT/TauT family transport system ATP-binding protein